MHAIFYPEKGGRIIQGEQKVFPDYKYLLQENYCTWNLNILFFK